MRACLLLLLSACATDDLGEATEDLSRYQSTQVCFLDGVIGPLSDGNPTGVKDPLGHVHDRAVAVDNAGYISNTNATGEAACLMVDKTTVHTFAYGIDSKGNLEVGSYAGNADTWCFLQSIEGNGLDPGALALTHTGNQWTFAGSYYGTSPLPSSATAICFDRPGGGWTYTLTANTDLRDYYPNGPQVPTAGVTCGLTGVRGNWVGGGQAWLDRSGTYLSYALSGPVSVDVSCF